MCFFAFITVQWKFSNAINYKIILNLALCVSVRLASLFLFVQFFHSVLRRKYSLWSRWYDDTYISCVWLYLFLCMFHIYIKCSVFSYFSGSAFLGFIFFQLANCYSHFIRYLCASVTRKRQHFFFCFVLTSFHFLRHHQFFFSRSSSFARRFFSILC